MIAGNAKEGDLDGMRFGIANATKDLGYYTRMTDAVPLTGTLGHAVRHALLQARNLGFADALVGHLIAAQAVVNGSADPAARRTSSTKGATRSEEQPSELQSLMR